MVAPTHDGHLQESPRRKIFFLMILVIGALIAIGFILMVKSHRGDPDPQITVPQPTSLLILPQSAPSPPQAV
jgi:hypothetical protein